MLTPQIVTTAGRLLGRVLAQRHQIAGEARREQEAAAGQIPKRAGDGLRAFAERARTYQAEKSGSRLEAMQEAARSIDARQRHGNDLELD